MKKTIILILTLLNLSFQASAQLIKGNWLFGGSATYEVKRQQFEPNKVYVRHIEADPNAAYFFADKFAAGIKFYAFSEKLKRGGLESAYSTVGVGPMVRYYFLPVENTVNLLAQASYQYTPTWTHDSGTEHPDHIYTVSVGPALYFNSSAALELTLNYQALNNSRPSSKHRSLFLAVGFQIHLEKVDDY